MGLLINPIIQQIGLTSQHLESLLIESESGNLSAQVDLTADMEECDAHIFSELDNGSLVL